MIYTNSNILCFRFLTANHLFWQHCFYLILDINICSLHSLHLVQPQCLRKFAMLIIDERWHLGHRKCIITSSVYYARWWKITFGILLVVKATKALAIRYILYMAYKNMYFICTCVNEVYIYIYIYNACVCVCLSIRPSKFQYVTDS